MTDSNRNTVAPATGKLAIFTPGLGAVATTFIAGVERVRRGLSTPIGSLTQMGTVRLGKRTDKHANQIFIVNAADRMMISTKTTEGTNWTDEWHHVKIVRKIADGTIEVYWDDMKTPVQTATNKAFLWGRVGIGSFDDLGNFDNVVLRGTKVTPGEK